MQQILSIASDDTELSSLLKDVGLESKPGHRKRFVAAIKILTSKKHGDCDDDSKRDEGNLGSVGESSNKFLKCV
ncbi:Hypothetical predicted protein [Paramuricea clavata]|uniref:Uncharacterized protein n=1 Tax=Paramuricea clavata TaxID=317549 RepID=A0A7D9J533_PARCT|nr:Hypothetical predicted protein [Paramuricea clavata]